MQRKAASLVDFSRCAGDGKRCLLRLAHSKFIGLGCLSAVADCNCFSIMICNRQNRFLCRFGGQLAAFPENRFICIVLVVHLNRQTTQVKLLSAGVGQFIRLLGNYNCTHSLFRSCDCHTLADGFRIVGGGRHLCKEVVGGICGQAGEDAPRLPGAGVCIGGGAVSVADCRAGIAGFYHSLIQSNLRRAVRLPGKRDLIRSRAYLHCKVLLYQVIVAATIFVVSSREGVLSHIANRST